MIEEPVVLAIADSSILSYERRFNTLTVEIQLWDESVALLVAENVGLLVDVGSWECDGVVRVEEFDGDGRWGYGLVDTDLTPTLKFAAEAVEFRKPGVEGRVL